MVKLIMGDAGAGKTKQLIDMIHDAVENEDGSVVCIEPASDMKFDIPHSVRLIGASEYKVDSYECLRGFLSGLYAGNYDISHVFVDNVCKIVKNQDAKDAETFLTWLENFSNANEVKFTATISQEASWLTDSMKQYIL